MYYPVKVPTFIQSLFPSLLWKVKSGAKEIYLTFDDGPHPFATPFVLKTLKDFNAKASFFCIGKNVLEYPEVYAEVINAGHTIGNHTHNHLNGWKVKNKLYLENIEYASTFIASSFFRPPYGKITPAQISRLKAKEHAYKIVMWDILSGDFDTQLSPKQCLQNVTSKASSGSIIVFHDSQKAYDRLAYALPKTLEYFSERGYSFKEL